MLYGYPPEATAENWFHECLVEIIQTIHVHLLNGRAVTGWPEIIPEDYRQRLRRRTGLRDRLLAYQTVALTLSTTELQQVSNALAQQNEISELLCDRCNCEAIDDLPLQVREPIRELFKFCFELLADLGIRDQQYATIYSSTPYHVCPFCGCEYFDAPGAPREALDHYLAESKYPFAATNLRNLVPMGNKCNSRYKLAQDILYANDGTRRRSFYPYAPVATQISLDQSQPFEATQGLYPLPLWRIDFEPASAEITTWDTVFHIRERYQRDILDRDFRNWLGEFSSWCHSAGIIFGSAADVIDALDRYTRHMTNLGINDRAFMKAAVFRMLLHHCRQGHQRLIDFLTRLVPQPNP